MNVTRVFVRYVTFYMKILSSAAFLISDGADFSLTVSMIFLGILKKFNIPMICRIFRFQHFYFSYTALAELSVVKSVAFYSKNRKFVVRIARFLALLYFTSRFLCLSV